MSTDPDAANLEDPAAPLEGSAGPAPSRADLRKRREAERLAGALRDNLRRRKEQARARRGGADLDGEEAG